MSEKDIVVYADNGENSGSNNGQSSTTTSTEWTWRDFRACLVTGAGFFMTAYDLFAMNLVSLMLAYVYRSKQNELTENEELGLKVSAQIGAIFGQLLFGSLADRYGRKRSSWFP
ncbi:5599_t:CDS:2 [Paraglomus occultum]|uniref:5599_t:CDS:1 n=1 Tax=Paraglomus occultum TaxID=144539 RepID=A0A9N9FCD5_9GLOM|nr:5599_t:CDS:2 [Paraglomus occultum]